MMNDITIWLLAGLAGVVLGVIFYGGLLWTVRLGTTSERPALWFFSSLLLRMSITLAGIYWVSDGHWERLLACFLGFILVRPCMLYLTKRSEEYRNGLDRKVNNAP